MGLFPACVVNYIIWGAAPHKAPCAPEFINNKILMAQTYKIYPYALLTVEVNKVYQIMRYNITDKDWHILPDLYTCREEALAKKDELNNDSGKIDIIIK